MKILKQSMEKFLTKSLVDIHEGMHKLLKVSLGLFLKKLPKKFWKESMEKFPKETWSTFFNLLCRLLIGVGNFVRRRGKTWIAARRVNFTGCGGVEKSSATAMRRGGAHVYTQLFLYVGMIGGKICWLMRLLNTKESMTSKRLPIHQFFNVFFF